MIEWQTWQWLAPEGFYLRGQHTRPRGLPVLHFIHGNSYCGRTYEPLWEALYPDFDIFLHDAQGHGDSDLGGLFVGWKRSSELALAAWKALREPWQGCPQIGIGHSFGGVLTSRIFAKHPSVFDAVVLLDPIIFTPSMLRWMAPLRVMGIYGLNPYAKRAKKRRDRWPSMEEARSSLEDRGMFKGWQPDALDAYVQHGMKADRQGQWKLKCKPSREAEIFSSYMPGVWRYLLGMRGQVHVIYGRETYPFVRESMRRWQRLSNVPQVSEMPGGHCFMQEHPAAVAAEVRSKLNSYLSIPED
ncbi:MAG: alpha/beta hydrolase [Idiomarina sp.]|nr:alpha/beta hydrolase [Idiomarina sp.]